MDVVVTGRHCQVSEGFREFVSEKLTKLEKLNDRLVRVEVEVSAERNPRQHGQASRVEITVRGKGKVIRAESAAEDKRSAFDLALDKLMAQLRKIADRKRVHRGSRTPKSLHQAAAELAPTNGHVAAEPAEEDEVRTVAGMEVRGDGPLVVREKKHHAPPMTLDQALEAMELVGHDFYLFIDAESGVPSVVYRRRAYDYGVIRLDTGDQGATPVNGATREHTPADDVLV
ncbi:MAG TPA: ribosome-associated translation inhibitor RaiA [Microlunatus sp.]|nr:ribosome-associated translation inhibitor RaiA [Microlunatus sp.]